MMCLIFFFLVVYKISPLFLTLTFVAVFAFRTVEMYLRGELIRMNIIRDIFCENARGKSRFVWVASQIAVLQFIERYAAFSISSCVHVFASF